MSNEIQMEENVAPSIPDTQITQIQMVEDIKKLGDLGKTITKQQFRAGLEKLYGLEKGELRQKQHNEVFKAALAIAGRELQEKQEQQKKTDELNGHETNKQKRKRKNKKSKRKRKSNKSKRKKKHKRKRKRNKPWEDDADAWSKKRRKMNSSKSSDTGNRNQRKDTCKAPERRLSKLKKLLKATGLGKPTVYKALKGKTSKDQVGRITQILEDNGVDVSVLSDSAIQKIGEKWALKREMADLGVDLNEPKDDAEGTSRRSRRNITNVSYVTKATNISSDEEQEELEEEYEPSDDDDDYDYC
eukprot:910922_1